MSSDLAPVYLFGILRARSAPETLGRPGSTDNGIFGPCRDAPQDALLGVVSDLKLPEGETLESLMADASVVEDLALHHHRTLEHLARQAVVLPLRFGCVFSGDKALGAALAANQDTLLEALENIDGAMEWGLKIYCERGRLGEQLAETLPEVAELRGETSGASEGKAFFLGRRLERRMEEETDRAIDRSLEFAERRLEAVSRRMTRSRPQPPEMHGRASEMVFNGAFLVDRGGEDRFFGMVDELRATYAGFGFDHEITGPWPPYSFVDCNLSGEDNVT